MVTAITLPRQFHLTFVELRNQDDLVKARWLLPGYMLLWSIAVAVIAIASKLVLPPADPDLVVLALPNAFGGPVLTAIAYLGGFSAGAAMVMMETVALSAMISNELILPALTKLGWAPRHSPDISRIIVAIRRGAIIAVLVLAYCYFLTLGPEAGLGQLGFTSLAASAQLFPSLVGAVFWKQGHGARSYLRAVDGNAGLVRRRRRA